MVVFAPEGDTVLILVFEEPEERTRLLTVVEDVALRAGVDDVEAVALRAGVADVVEVVALRAGVDDVEDVALREGDADELPRPVVDTVVFADDS